MTTIETLEAARKLITPDGAWTQEANARGKSGKEVFIYSRYAICFCASAAIWKAGRKQVFWGPLRALENAMQEDVAVFNDTHSHAEVLAAFDATIAKLRGSS